MQQEMQPNVTKDVIHHDGATRFWHKLRPRGRAWLVLVIVLVCALLAVSSLVYYFTRGNVQTYKPHIVFVLADDLGFHDVGYHGSRIQTPTIDKLAASGVILENYYVQPICSPSRCQLMSGRYQIHNGLQHFTFFNNRPQALPLDSPTIADKLQEAGYSTNMVGKWHIGFFAEEYLPNNRGFDTFFGTLGAGAFYYNHSFPYSALSTEGYLDLRLNGDPVYDFQGVHSTLMHTNYAVNLINNHDKNTPLFLYMAYYTPHAPVELPESYQEPYNDITDPTRRGYAGLVSMLDEGVANLTQALEDAGLWDDTIFIFASDNGGDIDGGGHNYPLRGWKFSLFEGGVRAAAFVTGGVNIDINRGVVNKELMHISDWFPTLVGVAGGNLEGTLPLDGVDQWETIATGAPSKHTWLLHNINPLENPLGERLYNDTFDTRVMAALRVGDFKLITGDPGNGSWAVPPEMEGVETEYPYDEVATEKNIWLFNITADPEERNDLSEQRPDLVRELLDFLLEVDSTSVPAYWPDIDNRSDPRKHGNVWSPWL